MDTKVSPLDIDGDPASTRVVVAMSGGVDSSVVAGLYARAGYDVVGVTLQLYDHGEAGDIVHLDGRVLGRHKGVMHYTIGQRKGLGIATPEPLYVIAINAGRREVKVGPREALAVRAISIADVNWLGDMPFDAAVAAEAEVFVKVRSTRPPVPARLARADDGGPVVHLALGEEGVAPGQACVLYDGAGAAARLLGGGTIVKAERVAKTIAAVA